MDVRVPLKRTVIVRFPNGERQYWLTDREFSEGETIGTNGRSWTVTEVILPVFAGTHLIVRVRKTE